MTQHSLRIPDCEDWKSDPDYSFPVAHALEVAYRYLAHGGHRLANYLRAYRALDPFRDARVSQRQRTRMCYVFGMAYAANGDYGKALLAFDEVLDLAYELGDQGAMVDVLHVRGGTYRAVLRFHDAVDDIEDSLALAREERDRTGQPDVGLEADLLTQLAGFQLHLARYDIAEGLLDEARTLTLLAPDARLSSAALQWTEAHIHRLRGQPERALRPIIHAAEDYATLGPPISAARIKMVAGDVVMDLAGTLPRKQDRSSLLGLAWSHIQESLRLAQEAGDEIGRGLALLTRARYSRLSGQNEDRILVIERVVRQARAVNDAGLLAHALTALADELAAQLHVESALNVSREVIQVTTSSELPFLAVGARRALLRDSEQNIRD